MGGISINWGKEIGMHGDVAERRGANATPMVNAQWMENLQLAAG